MRDETIRTKTALALATLLMATAPAALAGPVPEDVREHPTCVYCAMDREGKWSHTRHLVVYRDGHAEGTCSIRCVALSLDTNFGRTPLRILGADAGSDAEVEPLVPVEDLVYVLDPTRRGTMTIRRKWAYRSRIQALRAKGRQGRMLDFRHVLHEAFDDIADRALTMYEGARRDAGRRSR